MKRYLRTNLLLPVLIVLLAITEGFAQSSGHLPYPSDFDENNCTGTYTSVTDPLGDIILNGANESAVICIKTPLTNQNLNIQTNGSGSSATLVFCGPGTYILDQNILQEVGQKVTVVVNPGAKVQFNGGAIYGKIINKGELTLTNHKVNLNSNASIVNAGQLTMQNFVINTGSSFTNYGTVYLYEDLENINSSTHVYLAQNSLVDVRNIANVDYQIFGNGG